MLDRQQWAQAEAENQAELLAYLGTGRCLESYLAANITWVITGIQAQACNGVIWARLSAEEADQLVPTLVDRFRIEELPAIWHFDSRTRPTDLSAQLTKLGCRLLAPTACMAAPVLDVTRDMQSIAGLTISRVTTEEDLAAWMDVWSEGHDEARGPREALYTTLGLDRLQPLRHYLARVNGEPVGVSQVFLGQRAAGVYGLVVRPAFRQRGIGSALTQTPLLEARTLGYDLAVLAPTAGSARMHADLGFETFVRPAESFSLWP